MEVTLCRTTDPEASYYLRMARYCGKVPYEEKGWYCIQIYEDGTFYRAPDLVFQSIEDGTYHFINGLLYKT